MTPKREDTRELINNISIEDTLSVFLVVWPLRGGGGDKTTGTTKKKEKYFFSMISKSWPEPYETQEKL